MKFLKKILSLIWRKGQNIVTYKSLNELKIVLFWTIAGSGQYKLIDKNYTVSKNYTKEEDEALENQWNILFDESFKLRNNSRSRNLLRQKDIEAKFLGKISIFDDVLKAIQVIMYAKPFVSNEKIKGFVSSYMDALSKIQKGLKYDENRSIEDNIKRIENILNALLDKYKVSVKTVKKTVDSEVKNVYDVVVAVEGILGCEGALMANIDNMSFMQWLSYEQLAEKKTKNKLNNGKRK